jgi:hypothetical protein
MLVQIQLVKVDQLLKSRNQRGAVSCQAISLHYTTLALLDSESAINNNSFGVHQSNSSQQIGWNGLNVDDGPRNDLIVRHFPTLKGLGSFFDTIPVNRGALKDDPRMSSIFKSQLACGYRFSANLKWETPVLFRVRRIVHRCHETTVLIG